MWQTPDRNACVPQYICARQCSDNFIVLISFEIDIRCKGSEKFGHTQGYAQKKRTRGCVFPITGNR